MDTQSIIKEITNYDSYIQKNIQKEIFERCVEGIVITDNNARIEWINPAFTKITGYEFSEVVGKNPSILKSDRHNRDFYKSMWESLINSGSWEGEIWNRRKSGEAYPEKLSIGVIKDKLGRTIKYVSVFNDLTKIKESEEFIKYHSYHDALTDLPNRQLYADRLRKAILSAKRNGNGLAVMFIDMDDFKRINEGFSHIIGDVLLKRVGERLKASIEEDETVARMSGDEFTILLPYIDKENDAIKAAKNIMENFELPFSIKGYEIFVNLSIGICIYPYDGEDVGVLVGNAHSAMYRAKEYSGSRYQLYTTAMNKMAIEKISIENDLHKALDRGELLLYYQPKIDLKTRMIAGIEALVRWQHPTKGLVSPGKFIPIAEETGIIIPMGNWILKEACKQNKRWQDEGYRPIPISVNLSAIQFRDEKLLYNIHGALNETGLENRYLDIEITENIAMEAVDHSMEIMNKLRENGITLSMDDFGKAYSSLSYLIKFPMDTLKIDKSFIDELEKTNNGKTIVKAIIEMAHSLNKTVVAEGVETKKQLDMLYETGCDQVQGYYFSRPVTADEIEEMFKEEIK
ncbi:putative bifunctional diguanylate cyclase/phosphodiesterase [Clostridiisalibacter paucivorans]|uniref:putative bifunctional diguanylate cyclase/phosphodiesterase n=1 Tax=Clostridiisalibacter paucivorans TaxID=408753 RepID=UPI00068472D2|nr:EAL domain-containing protein [Clostridiisalibacter paucivorans]